MDQKPSTGRIVHYKLSEGDAKRIAYHRGSDTTAHQPHEAGKVYAFGNGQRAGDVVPLLIVRVWPDEYGAGKPGINGQAFLDGNDSLWVTSAGEGDGPGQWSWPPRV